MFRYVILLTIAGIVGSIIAIRKGHSPILQQEKGVYNTLLEFYPNGLIDNICLIRYDMIVKCNR